MRLKKKSIISKKSIDLYGAPVTLRRHIIVDTGFDMKKLYLGNLPYTVTEEEVNDAFFEVGKIDNLKFINDRDTGKFRGFAFVEMEDLEALREMRGTVIGGRKLFINEAREKQTREEQKDVPVLQEA